MKHGSLFSGIGGFDYAAEMMGWENIFHCEIEPFPRKVLNYYWPKAKSYEDIKTTDFTVHRGEIDILTGGFPCQPYSVAGSRKGKEDDRHLWPEMLRAIRELAPSWIVGENVPGIISWNGGMVFEEVCADLENEGYEVQPVILPAASVNAPHKRDRVWFVAHNNSTGLQTTGAKQQATRTQQCRKLHKPTANATIQGLQEWERNGEPSDKEKAKKGMDNRPKRSGGDGDVADPSSTRFKKCNIAQKSENKEYCTWSDIKRKPDWENFPTQSPVCSRNDGIPTRLDGITFSKWRNESIKAGGNAIVPQVALQIFRVIEQMESKRA